MVLRTKGGAPGLRAYPWGTAVPWGPSAPAHTSDLRGSLPAELCPPAEAVAGSSLAHKPFLLSAQAALGKRPPLLTHLRPLDSGGLAGAKAPGSGGGGGEAGGRASKATPVPRTSQDLWAFPSPRPSYIFLQRILQNCRHLHSLSPGTSGRAS